MLNRVEIQNFALIEQAIFEPGKHFTVISGETGAGKSLLIDALGSLTGKRSRKEVVRKGADFARIEAIFTFSETDYIPIEIEEYIEDHQLILNREILSDGGSRARLNGRLISISLLREIADKLIGLHAQNEQLSIFDTNEQTHLLDKFAGKSLQTELGIWRNLLSERKQLVENIKKYGLTPAERTRQLELLRYQIEEIESADLHLDEEDKLLEKNKILSSLHRIQEDLIATISYLSNDSENGAAHLIALAAQRLEYAAKQSKNVNHILNQLKELAHLISSINIELKDFYEDIHADANEVETVQNRLEQINKLKFKYGDSIAEILEFYQSQRIELKNLVDGEKNFQLYREQLLSNENRMKDIADNITKLRRDAGLKIADEITRALQQLEMPNVRFEVQVNQISKSEKGYYGKYGRDIVEFYIQANKGEELLPLRKIASGGEVSRILLAIKSILGKIDQLSVLIFDEIDAGISGQTAIKVAEMLQQLSQNKQVLCVSHMAQLAVVADCHYFISKEEQQDRTMTKLQRLDYQSRKHEVARLLSGNHSDTKSLMLAEQMLQEYHQTR